MKRLSVFLLVLVCNPISLLAQSGGSVLSRYGVGELSSFMTARQRGLGGLSVPLQSSQDISLINPASWTMIDGLRLQGDLSYEFESYSRNSNLSIGSTGLTGFQFAVPVQDELRSRIVFGFMPYSRVAYKLRSSATVGDDPYDVDYLGTGGLSLIRLGTAIRPVPFLHLGVSAQYFFGVIDREWNIVFQSGERFASKQAITTSHNGLGFSLGAQVDIGEAIVAGVAVEPGVSLKGSRNLFFQYITHDSTMEGATGDVEIPFRVSAGASWFVTPKLMIGAEMRMQDWTGAKSFDETRAELGKATRWSAGIEWQPGRGEFQPGFWRGAAYRLGVSMHEQYIRLGGQTESETFVTLGMGIPVYSQNRADVAFEYGWRGSDESVLGPRTLLRLSLAISVGESWFVRRGQE